jgi:hypothetical protein
MRSRDEGFFAGMVSTPRLGIFFALQIRLDARSSYEGEMHEVHRVCRTVFALLVLGGLVTGCGDGQLQQSSAVKNTTAAAQSQTALITALPADMTKHLSSYDSRLRKVDKLPVNVPSSVNQVLVISPVAGYAISQFQSVWPKLDPKPAVVWVGMSQVQTQQMWAKLGYHGDPLPSPVTLYEPVSVPVPATYRKVQGGWETVPGVLRSDEVQKWVDFFSTSKG